MADRSLLQLCKIKTREMELVLDNYTIILE